MLVWDATCPDIPQFASSHIPAAERGARVVADNFVPIVVKTSGVLGEAAEDFTREHARLESPAAGNSSYRDFQ